jgi:hypothetical protein
MKAYNKELFKKADQDMKRLHYQKKILISELFQKDQKAMHRLPQRALEVFRLEKVRVAIMARLPLTATSILPVQRMPVSRSGSRQPPIKYLF